MRQRDAAISRGRGAVDGDGSTRPRLGTILLDRGRINSEHLQQALDRQSASTHDGISAPSPRLGELLCEMGRVNREDVLSALAEQAGFERAKFEQSSSPSSHPEAVGLIAPELATRHKVLPLALRGRTLRVAMADPFDAEALEVLRVATGKRIERLYCGEAELIEAIQRAYGSNVARMIADLDPTKTEKGDGAAREGEAEGQSEMELQELAREPSVVNLVNLIILEAVQAKASDIHIEPFEKNLRVKYRIDGLLQEMSPPPRHLYAAIVSRIKIMAGMNIAERYVPQDGHIAFPGPRGTVDIRVGTIPTVFGESVALRLLDRSVGLIDLESVGFPQEQLERFRELLDKPHGIILVTGPTGSGKTTTLYASLNRIYTPQKKIVTIEDPVEYQLDGVNQIPVNRKRGLDFAGGLRSILRQDPDVIMVGEIRDRETADIAIRSALTGHLVFSTLHTNDAAGAVTRLLDMGVEPFLLASSLEGVLAQRLVRRICPHCKREHPTDHELLTRLRQRGEDAGEALTFFRGEGCRQCRETGYAGRTGLFELLRINEPVRKAIYDRANATQILRAAGGDHQTMREHGYQKATAGQTTIGEVLRVTQDSPAEEAMA